MGDKPTPRVWALIGHRTGDNNQVLALAEALGLPVRTIELTYNKWRRSDRYLKGIRLISVEPEARAQLVPPWPDVVLGAGYRSVAAALYIQRQSGGQTLTVRIGNPRLSPRNFDLTISPPQYIIPDKGNVLRQKLALGRPREGNGPSAEELAYLARLPRPHRLVALGGATAGWRLPPSTILPAIEALFRRTTNEGGTLLTLGSPRTDPILLDQVAALGDGFSGRHIMVDGKMPRYGVLLDEADEIYVTGDSVSMLSEAIMAGKPVGMIPIAQAPRTALSWLEDRWRAQRGSRRDLRRVWAAMQDAGLIGTVEQPLKGPAVDPLGEAAEAVRRLMRARGML